MQFTAEVRIWDEESAEHALAGLRVNLAEQATNAGVILKMASFRAWVTELPEPRARMVRATCQAYGARAHAAPEPEENVEQLEDRDGEGVCVHCGRVLTLLGDRFPHLQHAPGCVSLGDGLVWTPVPAHLSFADWSSVGFMPDRGL